MNQEQFKQLFRWEFHQTARSKLFWAVLLVLGAAMLWATFDTVAFHREQTAAQDRAYQAEVAHQRSIDARRKIYASPVTPEAPEVPYWQDPTSISGFSQYFILKHAMKPHLPLSPLAAGISDIAPSRLPIKLNTLFGFDDTYDFENPRGLALGRFDLAFVLAVLLPVALILIFGLLGTFERDKGMLRLIAVQSVSPRQWLAARVLSIMVWLLPVLVAELLAVLITAGVSVAADLPGAALAVAALVGYALLWSGICALVLSRLPGSSQALGQLATVWALLVVGLPLLWSVLASAFDPPPSGVSYVNAMRRVNDEVQDQRTVIIRDAFANDPKISSEISLVSQIDYATGLTFLIPETERRLAPVRSESRAHMLRQSRMSHLAGFAIPVLGLQEVLSSLAGTDTARHAHFLEQARRYQLDMREITYPLVQREAVYPSPKREPRFRGQFTAPEADFLPSFRMKEVNGAGAVLPFAVWTALLGLFLLTIAMSVTRRWPLGI